MSESQGGGSLVLKETEDGGGHANGEADDVVGFGTGAEGGFRGQRE